MAGRRRRSRAEPPRAWEPAPPARSREPHVAAFGGAGAAAAPASSTRDHCTLSDLVPDLDAQLPHHAGFRRRHFHRGLVGLERDQALVLLHRIAGLDQQLDHRHVL
jgi:hypothetical protein